MPTISGASSDQNIRIVTAQDFARQCIDTALKTAFDDNDKFAAIAGKYFSGLGKAGGWGNVSSLVMKVVNSMKIALDSNTYQISIISNQPSSKSSTNAACASWQMDRNKSGRLQGTMQYSGETMNVLEAQMEYSKSHGPSRMSIYPLFFDLPFFAKDAQCQVQSFLHELSHCAAGTLDIDAPACYGMEGVRYCMRNGTSAMNAENIAMFLTAILE